MYPKKLVLRNPQDRLISFGQQPDYGRKIQRRWINPVLFIAGMSQLDDMVVITL